MLIRATAVLVAAGALTACGGTQPPPGPPAHSAAERQWLDNASRFIETLDSDILLSTSGGANLATARRALTTQSDLYTLLVAYTFFGSCVTGVVNLGVPSSRAGALVRTLISACRRLENATTLFEDAVSREDPRMLLRATTLALNTEPLLVRARTELHSLVADRR